MQQPIAQRDEPFSFDPFHSLENISRRCTAQHAEEILAEGVRASWPATKLIQASCSGVFVEISHRCS
jgi:hypothetical protein